MNVREYRTAFAVTTWMLACGLTMACGGGTPTSPGGPTGRPDAFLTGSVGLNVFSEDRFCTAPTPAWGFFGPRVLTPLTISPATPDFMGRPEHQRFGDAELRFRVTPTSVTESAVTGSARGTLNDLLSVTMFPNPSHVTLSGATAGQDAELTGTYHLQFRGAAGRISGTLVYTDNQGGVMTCTEGAWILVSGPR
jgi:hypothetical protein